MIDNAQPSFVLRNRSDPVKITNWDVHGVAGGNMLPGQTGRVVTRLAITSDDPAFGAMVGKLSDKIADRLAVAGYPINMQLVDSILMRIAADDTADVWVNSAAVALQCQAKKNLPIGPVSTLDLADVVGFSFPAIEFRPNDRVLYIFRCYWRFGLFFDLWPHERAEFPDISRDLARLYRLMAYSNVYDATLDDTVMSVLIAEGWFPFVEILGTEFERLLSAVKAGWELKDEEQRIVEAFDANRISAMLERWMTHAAFREKELIIREAVKAYYADMPVAAIKIVVTEIEGLLELASRMSSEKIKKNQHASYAAKSGKRKSGAGDTLIFSSRFEEYCRRYIWSSHNPQTEKGAASSRHAVSHGSASAISYTKARALKAFLTLDQIYFCL